MIRLHGSAWKWSRSNFALPHTFKPQLTLLEAAMAACTAFFRILLGCLLFAVWGSYSLAAWSHLRGEWWRIPVILLMFGLFVVSFAGLMLSISAVVRGLIRLRQAL